MVIKKKQQTKINLVMEKQGYNAFWNESLIKDCPYNNKTLNYYHWIKGFVSAFNELMECMQ